MTEPMHYLPPQRVDKEFPQRLTLRGDDVDTLADLLKWMAQYAQVSTEEYDFIDRVMKATGRWGYDEWEEPLED